MRNDERVVLKTSVSCGRVKVVVNVVVAVYVVVTGFGVTVAFGVTLVTF